MLAALLSIFIRFESSGSGFRPRPWLLIHLWPLIQGAKFKKWSWIWRLELKVKGESVTTAGAGIQKWDHFLNLAPWIKSQRWVSNHGWSQNLEPDDSKRMDIDNNSILPPVTGIKNFDPQFSALTLDLDQNLNLTLDQILTTPINPTPRNLLNLATPINLAPRHFTAYSCAHAWTMDMTLDPKMSLTLDQLWICCLTKSWPGRGWKYRVYAANIPLYYMHGWGFN